MNPTRILVATDFSEPSKVALDYAIAFAKQLGAKLTVLHVCEVKPLAYDGIVVPVELMVALRDAAEQSMKDLCATYAKNGVELASIVRDGSPWQVIESVADEIGADIVVLGTHGRHGIAHALIGSVAEKVIRTSKRPVLTVRTKEKK